MNALIDDNRDKNYIEQHLQEDIRTQRENVIIQQYKTKAELIRYLHGACFNQSSPNVLKQ